AGYEAAEGTWPYVAWKKFRLFGKKQIPLKRIGNERFMPADSSSRRSSEGQVCESRFCPAAQKKSPPGRVRAPAPTWLGKSPRRFAKNAKGWAPGQKADSSPLKRIRNDKYLKAGSRRGAPRNDKCVKADSVRLREKSPHPGG